MSRTKVNSLGIPEETKEKREEFPFVTTYHPSLKKIGRIINQSLYILHMNEEVKSVFTPTPMVFFPSARKLSSYLVRAKLYPLERTVGSVQCKGKRCQTCQDDICLVYLLTCNVCLKQYVGQTIKEF